MSVNAINAADQQPQRKSSPMVPAVGAGVVTGLAGAGAGYLWGGGKHVPTLEEVFAQKPDEFTATMKTATDAGKEAADVDKVKTAYNDVSAKVATEQSAYDTAKSEVDKEINRMTDADGETAIKDANDKVTNRKAKEVDVREFNEKGEVIKDAAGNETKKKVHVLEMKQEIEGLEKDIKDPAKEAQKANNEAKLNALKNEYKAELEALEAEEKALKDLKVAKFEELAKNDGTQKTLKANLTTAEETLNNARKTAIGNVAEEAKTAFGNIKGALKEIKWGKIGMWGGIAAAVGLVAGYILGGSKNDVA